MLIVAVPEAVCSCYYWATAFDVLKERMWVGLHDLTPSPTTAVLARWAMNWLFPTPVTPMTAITMSSGLDHRCLLVRGRCKGYWRKRGRPT